MTCPPPTILFHPPCCQKKSIADRSEIRIAVIQAEYEPTGAHPTQRHPFGMQVILQHPIVARWTCIAHCPDGREIDHSDRKTCLAQQTIQSFSPLVPNLVLTFIEKQQI
jgi:hypothetical protein